MRDSGSAEAVQTIGYLLTTCLLPLHRARRCVPVDDPSAAAAADPKTLTPGHRGPDALRGMASAPSCVARGRRCAGLIRRGAPGAAAPCGGQPGGAAQPPGPLACGPPGRPGAPGPPVRRAPPRPWPSRCAQLPGSGCCAARQSPFDDADCTSPQSRGPSAAAIRARHLIALRHFAFNTPR